MDIALWVAQGALALMFLAAGFGHAIGYQRSRDRMPWVSALPEPMVRSIGGLEILGAIGLILPPVTGVLPGLTAVAAGALAVLMAFAAVFHLRRGERQNAVGNIVLGLVALFVAVGRAVVVPF